MPHWRDTYQPARLGPIDARAGIPMLGFAMHARLWTFLLALAICVIFWIAERQGLSISSAMRAVRSWVVGKYRPPLATKRMRGAIDTQRVDF